jgi:hypothetical protein
VPVESSARPAQHGRAGQLAAVIADKFFARVNHENFRLVSEELRKSRTGWRRELNLNRQGTLPALPLRRFFFGEIQMPAKSPKGLEMKGLDGSNPPLSTGQSGVCASLPRPAGFPPFMQLFALRRVNAHCWTTSSRW